VAATIKGRIERHDNRIEAFFDSIGPKRRKQYALECRLLGDDLTLCAHFEFYRV